MVTKSYRCHDDTVSPVAMVTMSYQYGDHLVFSPGRVRVLHDAVIRNDVFLLFRNLRLPGHLPHDRLHCHLAVAGMSELAPVVSVHGNLWRQRCTFECRVVGGSEWCTSVKLAT